MPFDSSNSGSSHHHEDDERPAIEMTVSGSHDADPVMEQVADSTRRALYRFFYPAEGKKLKKGVRIQESEEGEVHPVGGGGGEEEGQAQEEPQPERTPQQNPPARHPPEPLPSPTDPNARTARDDQAFVHNFWTTYDDILILSIFTQVGIVFRLASSTWFTVFDGVFSNDSALFVNLPLNCLSCFVLGMLCSGERLLEIIHTRFAPPRTQQSMVSQQLDDTLRNDDNDNEGSRSFDEELMPIVEENNSEESGSPNNNININGHHHVHHHHSLPPIHHRPRRRRRKKKEQPHFVSWQPPVHLNEELRDVQLLALERRIRMSRCLLLFPVKKEDVDVMEHYFHQGYKKEDDHDESYDLALHESSISYREDEEEETIQETAISPSRATAEQLQSRGSGGGLAPDGSHHEEEERVIDVSLESNGGSFEASSEPQQQAPIAERKPPRDPLMTPPQTVQRRATPSAHQMEDHSENTIGDDDETAEENPDILVEFTNNVQENVQQNFDRLRRVNLADGWDSGTTAEEMSDDLMLGLRDGFCGALSSFSSWNSAMVSLIRKGQVGEAVVGYMIGLQLPIIAYRFGQHVAVYVFIWRTRRETRKDERRGYGIRVAIDEESERYHSEGESDEEKEEEEKPSVRAIFTAIFIMALVTQCTSISFFNNPNDQQIALSLLFSPLGVLARWRLSKLNSWRPTFPIGTFTANLLACALSGSLGTLLAGNPGPEESIVLVSFIAGFGGTLSSLATFVVEILAGIDPILMRFDGMIYAAMSIGCAFVLGLVFTASVEWADQTATNTADLMSAMPTAAPHSAGNTTNGTTVHW